MPTRYSTWECNKREYNNKVLWMIHLKTINTITICVHSCWATAQQYVLYSHIFNVGGILDGCKSLCIRYLGLSDGHTPPGHSLNSLKIILQCPIVTLNKAVGNVSLDCTCFLLPWIFIKNPDAAAGAPPFHNVRKDCKGKHMWPTSSHQIK